jgi:SAM-dependent methyltransferase
MSLDLAADRPPIPPADLVLRVSPPFDVDNIGAGLQAFDVHGLTHLHSFERALALTGRTLSDFDRLLDFGCGCGRFIRHLGPLSRQVEVHGTDIDPEMINWLIANVPYGHYSKAPHQPPLAYPDQHFDLVINHSVFTHLDQAYQDLWLAELRRITRPGALVLLTVEGESSWKRLSDAYGTGDPTVNRWREELESRGILFVRSDTFIGSTHPDFYHSTFHSPWYVFEHWPQFFDIVAYLPDGSDTQDLIVLRRPADAAGEPAAVDTRPRRQSRRLSAFDDRLRAALPRAGRYMRRRREVTPDAVSRELAMLRAGLYEQSNRISVIAAELRTEIGRRDHPNSEQADGQASPD